MSGFFYRLTEAEYAKLLAQVKADKPRKQAAICPGRPFPASSTRPKSKWHNRATGGYASAREARRAAELKLLLAGGQIRDLREQVSYEVIPAHKPEKACRYVADFVYDEPLGSGWQTIVEDVKGVRTADYIIKRKLMLHVHGIRIRET